MGVIWGKENLERKVSNIVLVTKPEVDEECPYKKGACATRKSSCVRPYRECPNYISWEWFGNTGR